MLNYPRPVWNPARKAEVCYEQSQQLYDLVAKVLVQIITDTPGIIPPGTPGDFPPPVLDGSPAVPGTVGEVRTITGNINVNNVPNTGLSVGSQFTTALPPGDWELSYLALITGNQVLQASCQLDTNLPVAQVPGNMFAFGICTASTIAGPATIPGVPVWCPPVSYASGQASLLSFRLGLWSGTGSAVSCGVTFNGWARRMR